MQILRGSQVPRIRTLGLLALVITATVLSITTANECHSFFGVHHLNVSFTPSLLYGGATWFWWVFVASGLWMFHQRDNLSFHWKEVARQTLIAVPCAFVHINLLQALVHVLSNVWNGWGAVYSSYKVGTGQRYGVEFMIYGFVYAAVSMIYLQRSKNQTAIRGAILERQLSEAQLQALQMQLEPHFLFNTLNAIASLVIQRRNDEANETLDHLNTILRASLRNAPSRRIRLHEEVLIVESFLAIHRIRFPEQLKVVLDVSSDTLDSLVPPFLLQPIIENAVLHGVATSESQGVIETSAFRQGDMLHLRVWNSTPKNDTLRHKGYGIGQSNTRERLGHLYPGRHMFQAGPLDDGAYEVIIKIPFETAIR